MHIKSFEITNYKSFLASDPVELSAGFNVIVGQNNVGKTAFAEAVSLLFDNQPHRSPRTAPTPNTLLLGTSRVRVVIELGREELIAIIADLIPTFHVQFTASDDADAEAQRFIEAFMACEQPSVEVEVEPGRGTFASLSWFDAPYDLGANNRTLVFEIDRDSGRPAKTTSGNAVASELLAFKLADILKSRIYRFKAERLVTDQMGYNPTPDLVPDASNLINTLHLLQGNDARFRRFNRLVRTVLPEVRQVSVLATPGQNPQIRVWTVWSEDPDDERHDLSVPLSQSGSGIAQVLAILYIAMTAEHPRTLIIDEPQSYLHPGAIQKLFDVLRHDSRYPHQYIVITHAPNVVTAADPCALLVVRKDGFESRIEVLDINQAEDLRSYLAEVGARLADVFGSDNVLWVEGRTEEACFPKILRHVANRPLLGTAILGLVNTGDLKGKHAETMLSIYKRLSGGGGLLPPAVGFILDAEDLSPTEQDDLRRQLQGLVEFLPRRTFENYLLNPHAIAALAADIDRFAGEQGPIKADRVRAWLDEHSWDRKYIEPGAEQSDTRWRREVHGAKLLEDLFSQLSERRVEYRKVEYGIWLTDWLIANARNDLTDLAEFLAGRLPQSRPD